jgi:hypothetical protein
MQKPLSLPTLSLELANLGTCVWGELMHSANKCVLGACVQKQSASTCACAGCASEMCLLFLCVRLLIVWSVRLLEDSSARGLLVELVFAAIAAFTESVRFTEVGVFRLDLSPAPPSNCSLVFLRLWSIFFCADEAAGSGGAVALPGSACRWRAQNEVNGYQRRNAQTAKNGIVRASKHIVSRIAQRQHPRHPLTAL